MLSHLTPMITALSLALTADSALGWSRLSSMIDHRCSGAHEYRTAGKAPRGRNMVVRTHRMHEAQLLSFGP